MERRKSSETLGCGSSHSSEITLNIQTTTGGNFSITVENNNSVDQLKKIVSKKLKVSKDRICLLHRERQLRDGTLEDNGLMDGSRVILLPSVETGLLTQRPENSVMQALESLNDSQVNDFLSGKSPLNLTMRLGDHMMLIQLQLSTLNPAPGYSSSGSSASSSKPRSGAAPHRTPTKHTPSTSAQKKSDKCLWKAAEKAEKMDTEEQAPNSSSTSAETPEPAAPRPPEAKETPSTEVDGADDLKSFLRKQDIETLQNAFEIFKSLAEMQDDMEKDTDETPSGDVTNTKTSECPSKFPYDSEGNLMDASSSSSELSFQEQSPIKSLSNLVSSPLKSSLQPTFPTLSVPLSKVNPDHLEDKPPPKYVPLPSSLKTNLIDSIVEDRGHSENTDETEAPPASPVITDPIAANLTSCLCSTLNPDFVCSSNCLPSSHTITKIENSPNAMDVDFCEEQNHVITDSPLDEYPMENLFNNAVDKGLFNNTCGDSAPSSKLPLSYDTFNVASDSREPRDKFFTRPGPSNALPAFQQVSESTKNKRLHYLLHKTSKHSNPITLSKQKAFMQSLVNKHLKKTSQQSVITTSTDEARPSTSKQDVVQPTGFSSNHFDTLNDTSSTKNTPEDESSVFRVPAVPPAVKVSPKVTPPSNSVSDTKALIEASKNLTQTLKKLSKEVLTSKVDLANEESARSKIGQGAVIESMKHHGKGIYSGTFSGTLNPALQDSFGRPKRDISTIIHILNDLLCATPPQYRRGARITFEPTHNTPSSSRARQRESRQSTNCSAEQRGTSECSCSKCSSSTNKCPYGECNGHYPSPGPAAPADGCSCKAAAEAGESCACAVTRLAPTSKCAVCTDKERDDKLKKNSNKNCRKCHSASALALENSKTKCKLDQLRLVMQQKKQRREARKLKAAPYAAASAGAAEPAAEEIDALA